MSDLRAIKYARTRLAMASSLSNALRHQPLSDISVKAICRKAEVSEATFFNYFTRKSDLMAYLAQLWQLELGWYVNQAMTSAHGLVVIERLFSQVAKSCTQHPGHFQELLVWLARGGDTSALTIVNAVEKKRAFPELEGIDQIPVKGVDVWLLAGLESALKSAELPENTLIPNLMVSLLAILFGVPITLVASNPAKIAPMYQQQLHTLWAGTRSAAQRVREIA